MSAKRHKHDTVKQMNAQTAENSGPFFKRFFSSNPGSDIYTPVFTHKPVLIALRLRVLYTGT